MINTTSDINDAVCGDDLFYFLSIYTPDLLVLNINLSGLHGIECLKKIRLIDKALLIPIIIYSAFTSHQLIDGCYKEKANYFVVKPKGIEKAVSVLRKIFSINRVKDRFPARDAFVFK